MTTNHILNWLKSYNMTSRHIIWSFNHGGYNIFKIWKFENFGILSSSLIYTSIADEPHVPDLQDTPTLIVYKRAFRPSISKPITDITLWHHSCYKIQLLQSVHSFQISLTVPVLHVTHTRRTAKSHLFILFLGGLIILNILFLGLKSH